MRPVPALQSVFAKYATFEGRAGRPEFWWFALFCGLVSLALGVAGDGHGALALLGKVFGLAVLCPAVAVTTRRLHDTDRSGGMLLLALTVVGVVPLIFWLAERGSSFPNKYGPPVTEPVVFLS